MGLNIEKKKRRAFYLLFLILGHEIQKIHAATHANDPARKLPQDLESQSDGAHVSKQEQRSYVDKLQGLGTHKVIRERGLLTLDKRTRILKESDETKTSAFDQLDQNEDGSISREELNSLSADLKGQIIDYVSSEDAIDEKKRHEGDSSASRRHEGKSSASMNSSASFVDSAWGACGCAVALALLTFVAHHRTENAGYNRIGSEIYTSLAMAALLYWIAMPATMLAIGYSSSCSSGVPDLAYQVYGGFFGVQAGLVMFANYMGLKRSPLLRVSMESFGMLAILSCLENFDIATDVLFPGTAKACSQYITPAWLESWRQAYLGRSFVPILEALQFDGFALTMFTAGAFIPQFLAMTPFGTLVCFSWISSAVCIWVTISKVLGLTMMIFGYGTYVALINWYGTSTPWLSYLIEMTKSANGLAMYSNILVFPADGDLLGDSEYRMLLIAPVKLIFENIIQLWIQSSAFSLSFERLDDSAKTKALVSMGLGLGVFAIKFLPAMVFAIRPVIKGDATLGFTCLGIVPLILLGLGPWLWVIAKIVFAYRCESHIWNLSTLSCVQI